MNHGTHSSYCGGCRCEDCKRGHAAYVYQNRTQRPHRTREAYVQQKRIARFLQEKSQARTEIFALAAELERVACRIDAARLKTHAGSVFEVVVDMRRIASYI